MSKDKTSKDAQAISAKPLLADRKLFVEIFLKHEGHLLSETEKKRTRKEGVKNITDGEFWWKVCKEYAKKVSFR